MNMFHKHVWVEKARTYAPSFAETMKQYGLSNLESSNAWPAEKHGQTTILWECSECQELRREEMLGKEVK